MHTHHLCDDDGNLVDLVPFCSDWCHQEWCRVTGFAYGGWNGCHEGGDSEEYCAECGAPAWTPPVSV